ncbi:PROTEIN ARGININE METHYLTRANSFERASE NDUFAF7-like protein MITOCHONDRIAL [Salix koriyanagi]|uniref:Protein arginine methyltransferase NDUFAF7 n=1 Tax=Salix koriyanagi TaxID=2511006 RepID=A0A9Q0X0S6_9ROSI|nr:PROTEIN ARGININE METHYLTRANSFERASE NDUFAF7-like protein MITOCHONDRIAL [Salix koriyanagi]
MFTRSPTTKKLSFFFHLHKSHFSTDIVGDKPVLVRDFIHSALYDPKHGYFSQRSRSVGVLERSIKFNQLEGRKAYMNHLDKIYKRSDISWFTPVELFKPWYAHGIAEAIMRTTQLSLPLHIYEIGGGSGNLCKGHSRLHNVECTCQSIQQHDLHLSGNQSGWGDAKQQPCWVIMLEVLDNLPHDLVYSENQIFPWKEVWVEKQHDKESLFELYKPLEDPLIKRCVEIVELDKNQSVSIAKSVWSKVFPKPRRCWLPTGCLKLLEVLHEVLPRMSLIASDFSFLPDVSIPGERAPLVSTKKDGRSEDYNSYLDAKGDADIFFPTDFWLLERMDHYCSGWMKLHGDNSTNQGKKRRTLVLDTSAFMEEFERIKLTTNLYSLDCIIRKRNESHLKLNTVKQLFWDVYLQAEKGRFVDWNHNSRSSDG